MMVITIFQTSEVGLRKDRDMAEEIERERQV